MIFIQNLFYSAEDGARGDPVLHISLLVMNRLNTTESDIFICLGVLPTYIVYITV